MRAQSAIVRKQGNVDSQLERQQQKSKALDEDRKNFLKQADEIKQKNKEEIDKLRAENRKLKVLRDQFICHKKNKPDMTKTAFSGVSSSFNLSNTDQNFLRRVLDKQKHLTKKKKDNLFTLQNKLKEVEDNKVGYLEESPLMKNIRLLENRLDKIMIKYNEAQSIQKTYKQVVKRLKEERVGYDTQLVAVQNSLKGKQQDFQELLLLAHDATHAKQAAYAELRRFEQRRVTVQQIRTKYLNDKKDQLNKEMPQNLEGGKIEKKKMFQPKQTQNNLFSPNYQQDQTYQRQQLSDYQETFRRLKEVTGVIDANEIIQKFKTQGLTTRSLEQLKESYKTKIDELKKQKQLQKKLLDDNKFMKKNDQPRRRRLDQIQADSAKLTNHFERVTIKYQKLSTSLINVKAGIQHLRDLTMFYKYQGGQKSEKGNSESILKGLNEKLRRMYEVVKSDPNYLKYNYHPNARAVENILKNTTELMNESHNKILYSDSDENNNE